MFLMCCSGWSQHWVLYLLFMKEAGWRGLLMMHIFLFARSRFSCLTTKQIICFSWSEHCDYASIMSVTPSANWHYCCCFARSFSNHLYRDSLSQSLPVSQSSPSVESSICRSSVSALGLFSLVDFWNMQMLPMKIATKKRKNLHLGSRSFPFKETDAFLLFVLLFQFCLRCQSRVCLIKETEKRKQERWN